MPLSSLRWLSTNTHSLCLFLTHMGMRFSCSSIAAQYACSSAMTRGSLRLCANQQPALKINYSIHVDCACKPRAAKKLLHAPTHSPVGEPLFVMSVHCFTCVHPTQNRRVALGNHGRQLDRLHRACGGRGGSSTRGGGRCCGGRCGGGRYVGSRCDGSRRSCRRGESSNSGWSGGGGGSRRSRSRRRSSSSSRRSTPRSSSRRSSRRRSSRSRRRCRCSIRRCLRPGFGSVHLGSFDLRHKASIAGVVACAVGVVGHFDLAQLALLHESAHLGFEDRHGVGMSNEPVRSKGGGAGEEC